MKSCIALLALAPAVALGQARPATRPDSIRRDTAATLEAVTVSAIRARTDAPISSTSLDAAQIQRRSFGQDVPLLLQGTPSLTSYSETGNHWGYSYIRLRGIDQSRINLTLDGIPLNDPEDQVLYFADFPDFANDISSIQIQRGVGTSAPGTASYGGSINFETLPVATARRSGSVELQGGSFGSGRVSASYASGLLADRFAVYGRATALQSEGYRRHSGTEGRSGFLGAAWLGDRFVLKLTALAGLFADTLAYLGATQAELAADRRANILRPDEVDQFGEQVVALSYTRHLGSRTSFATTAYRISNSGDYDVCINNCDQPVADLWNFNLDGLWYGATGTLTHERDRVRLNFGINGSTYERDHHAYFRPDLTTPLYFNTGHKDEGSAFAKVALDMGRATIFADAQGRHAAFAYTPDVNAGIPGAAIDWSFFNPKIGVTFRPRPELEAYGSFGVNSREPARSDMFGGFDNLDTTNATFVGPLDRVRPERVHDLEAGVRVRRRWWSLDANAFAMEFRNEILPVGRLSYIGTPLRTNVPSSWRRGVETELSARSRRIRVDMSTTVMRARIARFTDDETGSSYTDTEPLLTPKWTVSERITYTPIPAVDVAAAVRWFGRARLTNTSNPGETLPSYYVADLSAVWRVGDHAVSLFVNNATNTSSYGGGHVAFGEPRFYVLQPVNVHLLARLRL
jgi:iron complex outermembrane receptor protein